MTRELSAARKPTGNTVPSTIGTSPKMSPGRRSPTTRSIPSTSLTASMRPSSTREERALAALVRRVLARRERDVRRRPRKPLALRRAERGEDRDGGDLVRRHHGGSSPPRGAHGGDAIDSAPCPPPRQIVTGVDFVAIPTGDLEASVEFYDKTLGLERSVYRPERNFAEFETGTVTLNLMDPVKMGLGELSPNRNPLALHVEDVEAARAALEERGVSFYGDIVDTGVCHMAFFSDPDGNALMLHHRYAPRDGAARLAPEQGDHRRLHRARRERHHHVVAVLLQEAGRPARAAQAARDAAAHEEALAGGRRAVLEERLELAGRGGRGSAGGRRGR